MEYDEVIQIPCSIIKTFPDEEIYSIINVVIEHYYEHGFPYYPIDMEKIKKEYTQLRDFDVSRLELPENNLQQFMLGLNTVNAHHPEMWTTQCKNAKTPMDIFLDRELFTTALYKRIKYSDTKLAPFNIRKSLKAFGTQAVSNFRPTIAKWVYQNFCPPNGDVLDPCMGYGGRLMGAFCSHVASYTSTDPNQETVFGNYALGQNLLEVSSNDTSIIILKCLPFEDMKIYDKYDLVFTSPPYFNIEKYSNDDTQSYLRYPNYNEWVEKFLRVLIEKSFNALRENGNMVLNVGKPIDKDVVKIGTEIFKQNPRIYHMRLSKFLGTGNKSTVSHKTEPIFVWKK